MDIKVSRQKMKKSTDPFSLWTDQKVYRKDYYDKSDDEL